MTAWVLLAPGPSASAGLAERLRGFRLGVVGCAYQLAPRADFIAATDSAWWRNYPDAMALPGQKYTMHTVAGAEHVRMRGYGIVNSGVLALEVAKRLGTTRILLCGFDMHGSHFFGQYTNGLTNTTEQRRRLHLKQYAKWAKANPQIEVLNCTPGSALRCFPMASIDDFCGDLQMDDAGIPGDVYGAARQHDAPDGGEALSQAA